MPVTPAIIGLIDDLATLIGAIATPTYNQDVGTVIKEPLFAQDVTGLTLPVVAVYSPSSTEQARAQRSKTAIAQVVVEVIVAEGADYHATWSAAVTLLGDIKIAIEGTSPIYGNLTTRPDKIDFEPMAHGNRDIAGALFHGQLPMTIHYRRPLTQGL